MKKTLLLALVMALGVGMVHAAATPAPKVSRPLTINLVDVGGALACTQEAFENYAKQYPEVVSRFAFTKAPAPELPGKLKAMQDAGRSDIDIVLGGVDIMANGVELGLWIPLFKDHAASFPGLPDNYNSAARAMWELSRGEAVCVIYQHNGPYLYYNPAKVPNPPKTPQELLDWCKANPNRFLYARPANSGPGRAFLMGLPYLLGDKDPKDPINGWEKTWAYLKELGQYIEYYTTGTGALMKELGEGSRDMTVVTTGWDINPRALGIVPEEIAIQFFDNQEFVSDAQYCMIPKGVTGEKLEVALHIINFMMQPEQQALTWDLGYFYPGPAIKDVPISMAPQSSQDCIEEYGRPEYDTILDKYKTHTQLEPKPMVDAFKMWDEEVGAQKTN